MFLQYLIFCVRMFLYGAILKRNQKKKHVETAIFNFSANTLTENRIFNMFHVYVSSVETHPKLFFITIKKFTHLSKERCLKLAPLQSINCYFTNHVIFFSTFNMISLVTPRKCGSSVACRNPMLILVEMILIAASKTPGILNNVIIVAETTQF